jgi:hypothetical protein
MFRTRSGCVNKKSCLTHTMHVSLNRHNKAMALGTRSDVDECTNNQFNFLAYRTRLYAQNLFKLRSCLFPHPLQIV